jgi:CO/xanthine dehydrogenase Mo-binding subunit
MTAGVGTCFAEVEVDTWTGDWRFLRSVYGTDTGLVINPLLAEAHPITKDKIMAGPKAKGARS